MPLVSRYADWLYTALRLVEPQLPKDLDAAIIQSVIDVYQNGWALARYNHRKLTGSTQFLQDLTLIGTGRFPPPVQGEPEEDFQKKLLALRVEINSASDTQTELKYRKLQDPGEDFFAGIGRASLGNVQDVGFLKDYQEAGSTLFVPPDNWQLVLTIPATGVAEDTFVVEYLWAEIPAGFNIGAAG